MKKLFRGGIAAALAVAVIGMCAPAAGALPASGAPLMPKGAKNLLDNSKVTGDNTVFTYKNDLLVCAGADDEKMVEFAVDNLASTDEYVLSCLLYTSPSPRDS